MSSKTRRANEWLRLKPEHQRFLALAFVAVVSSSRAQNAEVSSAVGAAPLEPKSAGIWEGEVGEGFNSGAQSLGVSFGANAGVEIFGGKQEHDLALIAFSYGLMLCDSLGKDHWYHGNLEFRQELFTGAQFSPDSDWIVGLTPHLRYHFATGTRVVPFVDLGAGATATGIGRPDLSGTFQFNLHAGTGVQWFLRDNIGITVEASYLHISCARISQPNLGLNGVTGMAGVNFYF